MSPTSKTQPSPRSSGFRASGIVVLLLTSLLTGFGQSRNRALQNPTSDDPVSRILLVRIIRAEDERRWDDDLRGLFSARNANVRKRAALAAGRIGNEAAVNELVELFQKDDEAEVRAMAAFALGEVESPLGADALVNSLKNGGNGMERGRAVEALGKIVAAMPQADEARAKELAAQVLSVLAFEAHRRSRPDRSTILLGLTAVLRAKPEHAGPIVAEFLQHSDPRVRADAGNTLARLKLNDGNEELRKLLAQDVDPVVRANAARVLGVTEDKLSFDALLGSLRDRDLRARVSAIRALGALKDKRATQPLLAFANRPRRLSEFSGLQNELLEVATALGTIEKMSGNPRVFQWLTEFAEAAGHNAPEMEIAKARVSPQEYIASWTNNKKAVELLLVNWKAGSSVAQGLGALSEAKAPGEKESTFAAPAKKVLGAMLDYRDSGININTLVAVHSEYAIPDVLRAFAAFEPQDLDDVARKHLKETDVVIRGTAADLLGELPSDEANRRALIAALPVALADKDLNDAALSILEALAKQKHSTANEAIKSALDSSDYLVRRRAVALLKTNGAGDFSSRIGAVQTRNTAADYERAIARIGRRPTATITTARGSFVIEFLPEAAPLNVDNFIQLAKRGYFNNIKVHRVVANFVVQDGDPRGDGNGGPGYQIRCEINEQPYSRGAVGMALSGKDTGGSQWFVTHSPQPHLDGGYTVFANVIRGMEIIDDTARGDVIRSISVTETAPNRRNR